ncbi:MAG: AMP-binding protein [Defluviitaleaceae bacterium]|nr:AMP-binding protein [Defluviitaleaceae bacterium]MCL2274936.1 AMP-binding protein [Defluviitaleaceae bacterium]
MKNYPYYESPLINNLQELIALCAEKYGNKTAFTFERNKEIIRISYLQFKQDVNTLASKFASMGLHNEKIAVIGENSYEWIITYFAAVNYGNVIVPLDKELPAADLANLIQDSGTQMLVYSNDFTDIADYLQNILAGIQHYLNMKNIPEILTSEEKKENHCEIDNNAHAVLLYTSGTTGSAKGVMLSHHNLVNNIIGASQHVDIIGSNMLVLPLHHVFGFVSATATMLYKGSEIAINASLKNVLSDLEKYNPSNMFLVPLFVETFYKKIWEGAKKKGKEKLLRKLIGVSNFLLKFGIDVRRTLFKSVLSAFGGNLKLIVSGGAPLDEKYAKGLRDFGINVLNGYGITECAPVVSVNRNNYYRDGSIGLVLPCCEVKILQPDEKGHGEICVKGDIVMLGYYKNERATAETFEGEWFKTGDVGYMDSDGFLYISGRKKNLIILNNGKNVCPEELESALLNQIPYIKEVVVFAHGQTITTEVFLDTENDPTCATRLDNDIVLFNKNQAPYKSIGKVIVRETEFPKTTTKKIKRACNREV